MSASNETPRNQKLLCALGRDIAGGMTALQAVLDLHHHTDATVMSKVLALEGDPGATTGSNANKGSQLVFKQSEDALRAAGGVMRALSEGAVKKLLGGYRKVMEGVHGRTHNAGWESAGFTDGTAVPEKHDERYALLAAMRAYLTANPGQEASLPQPNNQPPLAVTAAAAAAAHTAFTGARAAVNAAETTQELCKNARDADFEALYTEVSESTAELRDVLGDTDARWETFGLNIPASPNPPEPAANLTLTSVGPGRELAEWERDRRAETYRVMLRRAATGPDFVEAAKDSDLEYLLRDLTPGEEISAHIIAMNGGGDALPSNTVTKIVGA